MKQSTLEKRLEHADKHRRGEATVTIPFTKTEPQPMKDCPICTRPSPLTTIMRFVCRACRYLFD